MSEGSDKEKKDSVAPESGVAEEGSEANAVGTKQDSKQPKSKSEIGDNKKHKSKAGAKSKADGASATDEEPDEDDEGGGGGTGAAKDDKTEPGDETPIKSGVVKSQVSAQRSGRAGGQDRKSRSQLSSQRVRSTQSAAAAGRSKAVAGGSSRSRSRFQDGGGPELSSVRIGFVGAGRMTESITRGLIRSEKVTAKQLYVSSRSAKNFDEFKGQGILTSTRPYEVFAKLDCDVVFLCMHGFVIRNCFKMGGTRPFPFTTNYIPWKRKQTIILSVVGGISLNDIKVTLLNPEQTNKYNVVINRAMLNMGVAYNLGYGCLDVELDSKRCPTLMRELLQLLGRTEYLDGSLMDAACALGGNGMAFVFYYIGALADGGFKMGINRDRAVKLACKTLQSAAMSILESNKTPMCLRDEATGPSGPAIYGLNVMDKKDFHGGVAAAVEACYNRILELAENDSNKKTASG